MRRTKFMCLPYGGLGSVAESWRTHSALPHDRLVQSKHGAAYTTPCTTPCLPLMSSALHSLWQWTWSKHGAKQPAPVLTNLHHSLFYSLSSLIHMHLSNMTTSKCSQLVQRTVWCHTQLSTILVLTSTTCNTMHLSPWCAWMACRSGAIIQHLLILKMVVDWKVKVDARGSLHWNRR